MGIDVSTINSSDLRVTGPNGFNSPATLFAVNSPTNGTPRLSTNTFTPPGGSWDIADNGTYNIVMQANQVADTSGNFVAAGTIGSFTVNIPDTAVPTATPAFAPYVFTAGGSSHTATVRYHDNVAINVSTVVGNSNAVVVTGPNGFNGTTTYASIDNGTNGSPRTANYSFTPPGGTWNAVDNGTYNIVMQANQVADTAGNFVAAGMIGTFTVIVGDVSAIPLLASRRRSEALL